MTNEDRNGTHVPSVVIAADQGRRITVWRAACSVCGRVAEAAAKDPLRDHAEGHLRAVHAGFGRIVDLEAAPPFKPAPWNRRKGKG